MRWLALLLAGCSFSAKGAHAGDDAAGSTTTLVDDTAADFMAGTRTDLAVDSLGLLVPEAYVVGLHARSYGAITMDDSTTWESLVASLPAMIGERYGEMPTTNWGGDRPYSLGLTSSDYFTIVYDGEIYLAGPTTLQLTADDQGFIQVDLGTDQPYLRAHYYDGTPPSLALTPPAAGWYPIRGVISETYGSADFVLAQTTGTLTLRSRVTDARGITVVGSQDRIFTHPLSATAIEPQLLDRTWNGTPPSYDLQNIQNNDHALRYAGQLRIDSASDVTFALDEGGAAQHYARLFVDGTRIASNWPGDPAKPTSDAVHLTAGWHDVVADFAMYSGNEHVGLTANSAPIDAMHLRPVRTGALLAYEIAGNASTGANSMMSFTYTLPVPADSTIEYVDHGYALSGATRDQVTDTLDGAALAIPATAAYEGTFDYWPELAGPASATFTEVVATMNTSASVSYPCVTASYHGGAQDVPFVTNMMYVSAPHQAGGTITAVRVIGDLHGAQLTTELRTGDTGSIDTAPWVAPATMPSGALVEYRLTLTSNGWVSPAIDRVELDVSR